MLIAVNNLELTLKQREKDTPLQSAALSFFKI
jgi:hypothetical protein